MIGALLISNMCLLLILKGVPAWLGWILFLIYNICSLVAFIIWECTKDKIKHIEDELSKLSKKVVQNNDKQRN